MVVDVSCDPNHPYNPLPFYDSETTFDHPCRRLELRLVYILELLMLDTNL